MYNITILGLGWLGLPLAKTLQQRGWQVAGTKRKSQHCEIDCIDFELEQAEINEKLAKLLCAKRLIITFPPNTTTAESYQNGIKKLVEYAITQGLQQLIFISSISVLPIKSGEFDEKTPIESSLLAEMEQWLLTLPIHCDILRLAGLVGKQRHPVYYLAGKSDLTGANQPVNLVHLDDCIQAICCLIDNPNGARIFHLCSPEHPTRQDFYTYIANKLQLAPLHFKLENQGLARVIVANKIEQLGFQYRYRTPYHFPMPR